MNWLRASQANRDPMRLLELAWGKRFSRLLIRFAKRHLGLTVRLATIVKSRKKFLAAFNGLVQQRVLKNLPHGRFFNALFLRRRIISALHLLPC